MPIKTFFLEFSGRGLATDKNKLVVKECTFDELNLIDGWTLWSPIYRRTDNKQEMTWADAPEGATRLDRGQDCHGIKWESFMVKCPGGETWLVDSQAGNCTRPGENHQCWVRHGEPAECNVTVDKDGDTCSAGGGSVKTKNWHGFLKNGYLV